MIMGISPRTTWTGLALMAAILAISTGAGAPSMARDLRSKPPSVVPPLGNLLVSRSLYTGTASTVVIGQPLPGGGTAVADGTYPGVWSNEGPDGSFGVTSPMFIDRNALVCGSPVLLTTLAIPTDQLVTSFSSKSEMALHLSTDGTQVSFMGYVAPANTLDVSNSNTPGHLDPTNPVALSFSRAVALIPAQTLSSAVQVTPVHAYSGNNGRSAILDSAGNQLFMAGNAGNGGSPEPIAIVTNTGVQMVAPGGGPESTVVGTQQGTPGAANGFQFGFAVQLLGLTADKSGKDDNFRGITIFNNTLYVTKGSGGNGINTVYQVGTAGTLPTAATAASTPITILPGLPEILAKSKSGLEKWVLEGDGKWHNVYTLQNGLNRGVQYGVAGLDPSLNPAPDGLRSLTGRVNGDGTVTLFAVTSTISASVDQGADPNQLVTITDTLSFTTAADAAAESFSVLQTAGFGEVLRGVEFVPLSASTYVANLLQAALTEIQGLPDSDFKNHGEHQSLTSVLGGLLADLQNGNPGNVVRRLENVIGKAGAISDPVAAGLILGQLNAALGVLSGE